MHSTIRDVVYGFRLFRRNPGFSALSVLIISLGIGATTAIFSLINGIVLNPLPYRDSDRLAILWSDFGKSGGNREAYSAPAYFFDWRERSRSFESMAGYNNTNRTLTGLDQPLTPLTHEVNANYFDVLGVHAIRGRTFLPGEDQAGRNGIAVISYGLWKSAFGGQDSIVGGNIQLDGQSVKVIGVLPLGFRVPNGAITAQPDIWVPESFESQRHERVQRSMIAIGRLRSGVTLAQAQAEMNAIASQIASENIDANGAPGVTVRLIREELVGNLRGTFFLLLGAVGLILLIACANVASLLLARSAARGREFAMRSALGASSRQIVSQMLTESLLLALFGAAGGLVLAKWSVAPLLRLVPASAGLPFVEHVQVNLTVLLFAIALSAITAALFGLAPARQALHANLVEVLKESGRSRTAGRESALWRNSLVVAETAFSLVLLMSAGLMIQSLWRITRVHPGFEAKNMLTVRNSLRGETYATPAARRSHFADTTARLAALPGIESASAISFPPPITPGAPQRFVRSNQVADPGRESTALTLVVLPHFFETMRIPVLAGRGIENVDTADSAPVVAISQTLARRYFQGSDPVGQTIRMLDRPSGAWRVAGVVGDIQSSGVGVEPQPILYFPHAQVPLPVMTFVMRTHVDPASLGHQAEQALWSTGSLMNVYAVLTMEQRLADDVWQTRFTTILLSLFAGLALALASTGIYAVISYLASQRTQEIGIRMALGARPRDVLWMVTRQGVRLAAIGVGLGIAASLLVGRFLASRLFGVTPADPWTLAAVSILLLSIAAAACAIPARRAARIDPLEALHSE